MDEEEELDEAASEAWYSRAGPFDDLFGGSGEELLSEAPQRPQQVRAGSKKQKKRNQQPKQARQ